MKKYILSFSGLAVFAVLVLFVFSAFFEPINSLMRPPKVEGENLEIQLAFEASAGEEYILKSPVKGDFTSAFTFIDLNGDRTDEVVIFYSDRTAVDMVRMNVLFKGEAGWYSVSDTESHNNEVQKVEFSDLNGDSVKEIIVSFSSYNNDLSKELHVYEVMKSSNNVSVESIYKNPCSDFEVIDVNSDGVKDLLSLVFKSYGKDTEYGASYIKYGKNGLSERSYILLDKSISSVTSITTDYIKNENTHRIFIDGYKIDSGMSTDCIFWDNESDGFARYNFDGISLTALTSRTVNTVSRDVNGDGYIEIAIEEKIPLSSVVTVEKSSQNEQSLINWVQIENGQVKSVAYHLINSEFGYSFKFPDEWVGRVTVANNNPNGTVTFYELRGNNGQPVKGEALFTLLSVKKQGDNLNLTSDFKIIVEEKGVGYYCRIYNAGKEKFISKSYIEELLIFN